MKELVICIPTFNQPDRIREMFLRCIDMYREFDIDIYIMDSSPGNETEKIAEEYQGICKNILYQRFSPDTHSNIKVLETYKKMIHMGEYAYLWLCPDYIQLTREGAERILKYCAEGFDVCVLNYRDVEQIGEKVYADADTFFRECAWHMSSYMASVIRLASFLSMDWEDFYKRYTLPERINHSHVAMYFEQLAKLPEIKAFHIPVSSAHIRISSYRDASLWQKEVFVIWGEYWPDMIHALPGQYRSKEEVIKKLGVNTGIFIWKNFVKLRKEGIYNIQVYNKYQNEWIRLTNVPSIFLRLLAAVPEKAIRLLNLPDYKHNMLKKRLRRFCMRHHEIYLYGCGFMAKRTSSLLDGLNIKYSGYIVSDRTKEKQSFHNLAVIDCGEFFSMKIDAGIIVALSEVNAVQVKKEKVELGFYDTFYMYKYEDVLR